jgi:AGZA family xanthine/uracil permease-like MFS transporter
MSKSSLSAMIDRFFQIKERNTSLRQEFIGGMTTFLTMSYIIFLHPNMLAETGMDKGALITITCIASFIGTLIVGIWANVPLALAPGLGLNSFFTYSVVIGLGVDWQTALGAVFISGILFLILTFSGFRERIVHAIPLSLRLAVPAGIGLLITFVGLKNMGLIVSNDSTLLQLGEMSTTLLISLLGLILIIILEVKKIKGSILLGILFIVVTGIISGHIQDPEAYISSPPSIEPVAFKLNIIQALKISFLGVIFSFLFVDLFDSVGTIIACAYEAKLVKKNGNISGIEKILGSDAISTVIGSLLGTSTITTYIESASGISAGARTGLSSVIVGLLFLMAPFFAPLIQIVPGYATAPALIVVGVYMFRNIQKINFTDLEDGIPAFFTIIIMPFTTSISMGLSYGFLSFILLKIINGKIKQLSPILWIVGILSLANMIITS